MAGYFRDELGCRVALCRQIEIRDWPVIGRMVANGGTLFIEREKRRDTAGDRAISHALKDGDCRRFPEGTTANGLELKPFKSSMFQPAIEAGADVLPVALRYLDAAGKVTLAASYAGKITLLRCVWNIVSEPEIYAELIFGLLVNCVGKSRRELCQHAELTIATALSPAAARQETCQTCRSSSLSAVRSPHRQPESKAHRFASSLSPSADQWPHTIGVSADRRQALRTKRSAPAVHCPVHP